MHIKANIVFLQIALAVVLVPAFAHAAISNGASAISVLGQYDDSLTAPGAVFTKGTPNNGPNKLGLSAPYGTAIDAERRLLFVADSSNNRVLVFNLDTDHTLLDHIPDYVLGQENFYSNAAATSLAGMSFPLGLAVDTDHDYLFVADHTNNRILAYDLSSLSSGMNASYVIGQTTFTSSTAATTQEGLRNPYYLAYTGSTLYVGDSNNNRVLVFSGSTTTGMSAWRVLGQSDFTSSGSVTTQAGMNSPRGVSYDSAGRRLFVADRNNKRILVFSGSALTNGMNAAKVLGQTSFTLATANQTTQSGLWEPSNAVFGSGSFLYVADTTNHRIMVYDVASISDGENAVNVLGQSLFTSRTAASTQSGLNDPRGLAYDERTHRLYVSQITNNRVSAFNIIAITDGENAVDLVGQYDDSVANPQPVYTKSSANDAPNRFGLSLNSVASSQPVVDEVNHRLFIPDTFNNRVLVYNLSATNELEDRVPDNVLGQSNFYTNASGTAQAGVTQPNGLAYDSDNQRLFVISPSSSKVMVYDVTTITNGEDAVYVLGQPSLSSPGGASLTSAGMNFGRGVAFDQTNQRLFVADTGYSRVIVYVFTGGTITTGMSGSNVLGQTSFATSTTGLTASTLNNPYALAYDDNNQRLFVADNGNSRIMVFDVSSITNGEDAVHVIGKSDFTSAVNAPDAVTLVGTRGVAYDPDHQRLFVTNISYNRVMVFDVSTITNGEAAIYVLGQSDFTSIAAATTQSGLNNPQGAVYVRSSKQLFVADRSNNRIMVFDVAPPTAASSSSSSSSVARTQSGGGRRGSPGRGGIAPEIDTSSWRVSDSPLKNSASDEEPSTSGETFSFRDVPNTAWFYDAVQDLASRKIISGYTDSQGRPLNLFGSADPVTIGQILKIALLGANYQLPVPSGVPRNPTATDWSAPYVALAESLKLTLASENVSLPATRGQVIRLLMEAANIDVSAATSNPFSDLDSSDPNSLYILKALELGIVTGDTHADGLSTQTVRPGDMINRAEVAVLVMRFIRMSLAQ